MNLLKAFLQDKVALLMTLVGSMFAVFNLILVLLQLNTTKTVAIIRYNSIALPEFTRGDTKSLYVFALAPFVFLASHIIVSVKMYEKHKGVSIIIMGLSYIVLLFGIIVSSAVINVNK